MNAMKMTRWGMAMIATVAVAAALRFIGLGSGLWFDEMVTLVESARLPIAEIVTHFPNVNVHPLYSVLAHVSLASFGESAWALRLPACLFGIGSVVMTYVLGVRVLTRAEAWASATILAVSYQHIWFSQNARGYTLMGFFALLSTYYLFRAADTRQTRDYVIYALACAAGVYTHLTMAFVVAGHVLVILGGRALGWRETLGQSLKPLLFAWAGATVLSMALYAPYAPNVLAHFGAERPRQAAELATGRWAVSEVIRNMLSGAGIVGALVAGLAAVFGAWSFLRRAPFAFALLVVPALVAGAAIVVLGQPMRPRFFFFVAGAAALFVGRALGAIAERVSLDPRRSATVIVVATFVVISTSAMALPRNYRVPKQDFDGAVRYLEVESASGAAVGAVGPGCFPIERYYLKASWPCLRTVDDLNAMLATSGEVRLLYTLFDYIDNAELRTRLRTGCAEVRRFPGTLGGGHVIVCDPRTAVRTP